MILHIDMDAFYAAVEQRDRPELRGRPVIVGGTPEGRGVVCAANYEARKFGVQSAMPTATAVRLCPQAVFLPTRISHYAEISEQIRAIFQRYTPLVEPLSLDEAFLDVAASEKLFGSAETIGRRIQVEIRDELRLTASVGVAPNKFLAKIASDLEKPHGFVVVDPDSVQAFLDPLPVGRLWGVGKVTNRTFEQLGVRTIRDLRELPTDRLEERFGEQGRALHQLAQGRDARRVVPTRRAKSISHETTFAIDLRDPEVLRGWVIELAEQVAWRVRRYRLRGGGVQLKARYANFQTVTRSQKFPAPTDSTRAIAAAAAELLEDRIDLRQRALRLVGVGVSDLREHAPEQLTLFGDEQQQRDSDLDEAADAIRERFGRRALGRAASMLRPDRKPRQ